MGLGKTIESISILCLIHELKSQRDHRHLRDIHNIVIVPKVTLGKWNKELAQWAPTLRVFQFYGTSAERDE